MPTVPELRRLAREKGLSGYSNANKARLLEMLGASSAFSKFASPTHVKAFVDNDSLYQWGLTRVDLQRVLSEWLEANNAYDGNNSPFEVIVKTPDVVWNVINNLANILIEMNDNFALLDVSMEGDVVTVHVGNHPWS